MDKMFITHDGIIDLTCDMIDSIEIWRKTAVNKLRPIHPTGIKIFPVPRGGVCVAYLLVGLDRLKFKIVNSVHEADIIIDDLIDSGNTMQALQDSLMGASIPNFVLIDKRTDIKYRDKWIVFPWEIDEGDSVGSCDDIPLRFLQYLGENTEREGLIDTPKRVINSWEYLYKGYRENPDTFLKVFDNPGYDQMIVQKDIDFYSTCEHHILPFFGKIHIAYIPDKKIVGISKLARIVEVYSRRLQVQERLTEEIAGYLNDRLSPLGVAVYCEAKHMCIMARGIEKENCSMVTSAIKGRFLLSEVRQEFFNLVKS